MGGGAWRSEDFKSYSKTKGMSVSASGVITGDYSAQEMFKARKLDPALDPKNVIRECCDSEEHPNTLPIILALDVTGSMGKAAIEVAKKLNVVMTELYSKVKDVQFMAMGIGDFAYDRAPLQVTQFESDIRIAEQMDKIWFEFCGGGNQYESYSAAWYFGLHHTKLDCWKRGKRGIIITLGDETLNPYIPRRRVEEVIGDSLQGDVETADLYKAVTEFYDVYHLAVDDYHTSYKHHANGIRETFGKFLDEKHLRVVTLDNLANEIIGIVSEAATAENVVPAANVDQNGYITW